MDWTNHPLLRAQFYESLLNFNSLLCESWDSGRTSMKELRRQGGPTLLHQSWPAVIVWKIADVCLSTQRGSDRSWVLSWGTGKRCRVSRIVACFIKHIPASDIYFRSTIQRLFFHALCQTFMLRSMTYRPASSCTQTKMTAIKSAHSSAAHKQSDVRGNYLLQLLKYLNLNANWGIFLLYESKIHSIDGSM